MTYLPELVVEPEPDSSDVALSRPERGWDYWLEQFLSRKTGHTEKAYRIDLTQWATWCLNHDRHPFIIEPEDIDEWIIHLEGAGGRGGTKGSANTVARKLASLGSLYKFLKTRRVVPYSPMEYVERPSAKGQHTPTPAMDVDQAIAYLQAAVGMGATEHLVARLYLGTGIRADEGLALNVSDVVQQGGRTQLQVTRKGKKIAYVPMPGTAAVVLLEHIAGRDPDSPLFTRGLHRLSYIQLYRLTKLIGVRAGIPFDVAPHVLRATFATTNFDSADGRADWLQDSMGHASGDTTRLYDRGRERAERLAYAGDLMDRTVLGRVPITTEGQKGP